MHIFTAPHIPQVEWDTDPGRQEVQTITTSTYIGANEVQTITTKAEDRDEVGVCRERARLRVRGPDAAAEWKLSIQYFMARAF